MFVLHRAYHDGTHVRAVASHDASESQSRTCVAIELIVFGLSDGRAVNANYERGELNGAPELRRAEDAEHGAGEPIDRAARARTQNVTRRSDKRGDEEPPQQ